MTEQTENDRNLMIGVLALQSSMITTDQFIDACSIWAIRHTPLDQILISQGWLDREDQQILQRLIQKKLGDGVSGSTSKTIDAGETSEFLNTEVADTFVPGPANLIVEALGENRLEISELHSSGGIGRVWRARDTMLNRDIACKELLPAKSGSDANRARFFREAQITAQLTHPGTVPVYDYVDDGKQLYYTMKFVKGRTLTEVVEEFHQTELSNSQLITLLNYFTSICQTISFAHSKNVIHRDLKGDNVIIGDFGEVIVLDWGLAKQLDMNDVMSSIVTDSDVVDGHTIQGDRLGTPAFMAPEQAEGRIDQIDFRTDVYGLAAMLYVMLCGNPPFTGKSISRVLADVCETTPSLPSEFTSNVPAELEQICLQGLSKDRGDRQQSADEIRSQIENWISKQADRKQTEKMRERFFGLSLDLLGILDTDGIIGEINPSWEMLLGWTKEDLKGTDASRLVHPDELSTFQKNIAGLREGKTVVAAEHRIKCKDGSWRWMQWNASLLSGGELIYIVGRDIQELKLAERKFSGLLEAAPDAIVAVDLDRVIRLVNYQTEVVFGYNRDELIGQPIEILIPERFTASHPEKFEGYVNNPSTRPMGSGLKLSGKRKDGSEFPAEISLSPMESEDGMLIISTIRDVSQRERG